MMPVWFESVQVGELSRSGDEGLAFHYDPAWVAEGRFPISVTMPLHTEPYDGSPATAWFANLLPEDAPLQTVADLVGRDASDLMGLLSALGRDTAGALSICLEDPTKEAQHVLLDTRDLARAILALDVRPLMTGKGIASTLSGVRPKLAVTLRDGALHLPLFGAASSHILKPQPPDQMFGLVENELLCTRLAAAIGIAVPDVTFGDIKGIPYLLVERYDRQRMGDGTVHRLHQEDFCQATGRFPAHKFEQAGGLSCQDLFATLTQYSSRAAADRLALLDMIIFAVCIGDTNRHAKNLSLLISERETRLAPAYDLVSSLVHKELPGHFAFNLGGQSHPEKMTKSDWQQFAHDVGLAPAAALRRVEELSQTILHHLPEVARDVAQEYPAIKRELLVMFATAIAMRSEAIHVNCAKT